MDHMETRCPVIQTVSSEIATYVAWLAYSGELDSRRWSITSEQLRLEDNGRLGVNQQSDPVRGRRRTHVVHGDGWTRWQA